MPRITEERREQVRRRLVDAAVEALEETGGPVTTRDVLGRAGLSFGALYHYFTTKGDLFAAVAQRIFLDDLTSVVGGSKGRTKAVSSVLRDLFRPRDKRSLLPALRLAASTDDDVRAALRRYDEQMVGVVAEFVHGAKTRGEVVASADSEAVVELVLLVFEAVATRERQAGFVTSRDRVTKAFVDAVTCAFLTSDA